ncbi:hypothetical protein RB623_24225 [Mesorhizobium sp. LHD-90]|uniref:hypothetical protein n=1 Tax=Mesorhizobium sp. LHD-90 TaxID=3071414 RepID=UPI0027E0FC43|nr:hypothetical protein [Mesorhizobium sp. LHD-90]MDQ6437172.1 hypothetical protein [Mesorhizobium sp. LHD-90]
MPATVTFWQALKLIHATFVNPKAVVQAAMEESRLESEESRTRSHLPFPSAEEQMLAGVHAIAAGIGKSLIWACGIGLAGFALGQIALRTFGPSQPAVVMIAITAGLLLMWAALGVQGWNIQSIDGTTLPERINQWIYRSLSITGAFLAVVSASWGLL